MPANFPPAEKPNSGNVSLTVLFDVCEMFFDAFGAVATEKFCIDLGSTSLKDTRSTSIFTGLPQNTSQKQVKSPLPFSICSCRKNPHLPFSGWYGKECVRAYEEIYFEPDTADGEVFVRPTRQEWLLLSANMQRMMDQVWLLCCFFATLTSVGGNL